MSGSVLEILSSVSITSFYEPCDDGLENLPHTCKDHILPGN